MLTKEELVSATDQFLGHAVEVLDTATLLAKFTVAQHCFDVLLNELERRGEVTKDEDREALLPYECDFSVKTILTRQDEGRHSWLRFWR